MIRCENLAMRYGGQSEVLSNLGLDVQEGSFLYVHGHSGAGKSTLLKLLSLQCSPTRGRLFFNGQEVTRLPRSAFPALRRQIGIVAQDFRLISGLSVFDNVALGLRLSDISESEVVKMVDEMLEWSGLWRFARAYPQQLSGSQQQQLAVVRAVVTSPKLLVADEPTSNIDVEAAERLMALFEELHNMGTTVIMATHDQQLMQRFPHEAIVLHPPEYAIG